MAVPRPAFPPRTRARDARRRGEDAPPRLELGSDQNLGEESVSRGPGQGSLARSLALAHEVTGRRWGTTDPELCSHFSFGRTRTLQLQPAGGRGRRVGDVTTGRAKGKATNKNQGGVLEVSDARDGRLGVWAERRGWGGGRKRTSSAAPSLKRVSSEIQLGVMR